MAAGPRRAISAAEWVWKRPRFPCLRRKHERTRVLWDTRFRGVLCFVKVRLFFHLGVSI